MPSPVALVCFDLGGVLVVIANGWTDACRRAAVPKPAALDDPQVRARLHELLLPFEIGRIDADSHARDVAACLGLDPELVRRVIASWLVEPYPGAAALLADVARTGCPCACLSNTNAPHWQLMLDPAGAFRELFDGLNHRFASHLMGAAKPDAAVFRHVEVETGAAPEAIVFFDDLAVNVEAARDRGWRAHHVMGDDPIAVIRGVLTDEGVLVS